MSINTPYLGLYILLIPALQNAGIAISEVSEMHTLTGENPTDHLKRVSLQLLCPPPHSDEKSFLRHCPRTLNFPYKSPAGTLHHACMHAEQLPTLTLHVLYARDNILYSLTMYSLNYTHNTICERFRNCMSNPHSECEFKDCITGVIQAVQTIHMKRFCFKLLSSVYL